MNKLLLFILSAISLLSADSIYPITREMGSGSRSAFIEIFGIYKESNGKKIDAITKKAEVTNSTGVMLATIATSKNAIGYVSLGSLNESVKALKIDGIAPSRENITNQSYRILRPFHIVTKRANPLVDDFLAYCLSAEDVIEQSGYIVSKSHKYHPQKPSGKIIVAGSSSITPLMEKLAESYQAINPNATIQIQQSDSSTGISSVFEGIADIGMVSRNLKQSELDKGLKVQVLAIDGLAVVVHKDSNISNLSKDTIKAIYTGQVSTWEQIK